MPQVHVTAAAFAAVDAAEVAAAADDGAGDASGSKGAGETLHAEPFAAAAQSKRKRPLSGGVLTTPANGYHHQDQLAGSSQPLVGSIGAGSGAASPLATLAESSIEAAAATSKGLKHFSLKVSEKVEGKGFTNYNEVADELIKEMLTDNSGGNQAVGVGGGSQGASGSGAPTAANPHDDKNIRRRVYDALNVLEALGIIAKTKRNIEWRGWPPALRKIATEKERLEAERARVAARIQLKIEATEDVTTKAFCLSNLVLRNRDAPLCALIAAQHLGMMAPNPLALPFMLVHAPETAEVDIEITPDEKMARLDFHHHPFQIFDDENVMQMMGLGQPQPELAAAIFGSTSGGIVLRENEGCDLKAVAAGAGTVSEAATVVDGGVGEEENQLQDPLDVAHTAFLELPEYQQHAAQLPLQSQIHQPKHEYDQHQHQHQQQQQQQHQSNSILLQQSNKPGNNSGNKPGNNSGNKSRSNRDNLDMLNKILHCLANNYIDSKSNQELSFTPSIDTKQSKYTIKVISLRYKIEYSTFREFVDKIAVRLGTVLALCKWISCPKDVINEIEEFSKVYKSKKDIEDDIYYNLLKNIIIKFLEYEKNNGRMYLDKKTQQRTQQLPDDLSKLLETQAKGGKKRRGKNIKKNKIIKKYFH